MLQYLLPSKIRRRLFVLLWAENTRGSVSELAEAAGLAFSNAHAELRAMQQNELVQVDREHNKEVFSANRNHPKAALLSELASDSPVRTASTDQDLELKGKLVALGAPLRGVASVPVPADHVVATLGSAMDLARRDPAVARSLPLCVWKHRERFDAKALKSLALGPEDKHVLGFFLELAGDLGGDMRLAGRAEILRDERLTQLRAFFRGSATRGAPVEFDVARKWGFLMNMDRESFRGLFEKFVRK